MRHEAEDLTPCRSHPEPPVSPCINNTGNIVEQETFVGELHSHLKPPGSPCINNQRNIVEQETYMKELSQTTQAPSLLSHINITPRNSLRSRPQWERGKCLQGAPYQSSKKLTYLRITIIMTVKACYVKTHALQTSQLTRTYRSFKLINSYYSNLFTKQESV